MYYNFQFESWNKNEYRFKRTSPGFKTVENISDASNRKFYCSVRMKPQLYSNLYHTIYNPLPKTPQDDFIPDLPVICHPLSPTPDFLTSYMGNDKIKPK